MFEKTQQAATQLSQAVTQETNEAVSTVKAMIVPAIAGLFGSIAGAATKAKENVESGEFLSKAKATVAAANTSASKPAAEAAPLPTEEQNAMINSMRRAGVEDDKIAAALNISVLTVKMAWA